MVHMYVGTYFWKATQETTQRLPLGRRTRGRQ